MKKVLEVCKVHKELKVTPVQVGKFIVMALAFILFNPCTSDLLAKCFPTVFNSGTLESKQVRASCPSLILGLSFLAVNLVVQTKNPFTLHNGFK